MIIELQMGIDKDGIFEHEIEFNQCALDAALGNPRRNAFTPGNFGISEFFLIPHQQSATLER